MKKIKIIILLSLFLILIIRFFCGVFENDEFGDDVFFIKHKPTWKWKFYSPRGMGDVKMNQMSIEQQYEQKMFNEFVDKRITQ
jgi:hypothetical protein